MTFIITGQGVGLRICLEMTLAEARELRLDLALAEPIDSDSTALRELQAHIDTACVEALS